MVPPPSSLDPSQLPVSVDDGVSEVDALAPNPLLSLRKSFAIYSPNWMRLALD